MCMFFFFKSVPKCSVLVDKQESSKCKWPESLTIETFICSVCRNVGFVCH